MAVSAPIAAPQPKPAAVAEMEEVSMHWNGRPVLDRVNLRLVPGERLMVVGPSGAGKSTILRLLAGLLLPSAGRLRIHGDHNRRTLRDQGFGIAADAAIAQRLHTHQQAEQAVGMAGVALPGDHDAGHGLGVRFGHAVVAQHVQRQVVQLRQR